MLFQREYSLKCVEMIYKGYNSFQAGLYTNAIQYFENYFYAAHSPFFDVGAIPKRLHVAAHHYSAKSYAQRDSSEDDRKKAIAILQSLLRQQKVERDMHEIMLTLLLMGELHTNWGKVISNYRMQRRNRDVNHDDCMQLHPLEREEFSLFTQKLKGIEI